MASNAIIHCNSSSSHLIPTYDVFVSFRGEDTRNNFTGFLFEALGKMGIDVFKDDTHLKKGEFIAPELLQAIEGSRIYVVVFSKNYASSKWCLRELAHICNCIETPGRHVLPIFYDVDPSDVRKQSGYFEKAFSDHEERFREEKLLMEEIQRWREALTRVANHSGWDIRNKPQYTEIEEIAEKIRNILGHKFSCLPNDNLVGIESSVEVLSKRLCLESLNDVRAAGISGMGGIGKTTLVRALYERISHKFDFCCFIDDVSKLYQDCGTLGVQKQLLYQCLNEKNLEIFNVSEGTSLVWSRVRNGRALIVLDNVDHVGQLKIFTGSRGNLLGESLGGGSRIIIISRDEHILRTHGVDDVYQVQPLNDTDAVRLFYQNAFKSNYVKSGYEEFTDVIMLHCQGHPLAIEVLGSSLFGRSVSQWRSALIRLRENKSKDIMDVLRVSFDQLDDTEKETFLDIACFLNYGEVEYVKEVLEFRGFHPEYGLQVLIDKSLIKYGRYGNHILIEMHMLLVDLGRCIVRDKAPKEPRKRCRLWDYKDLHKVMSDNMAAENLEAIVVRNETSEFHKATVRADALSKMSYLQLLDLTDVNFSGNLNHLSNELGYLRWINYPFDCLPPSFQPEKLVELSLIGSDMKQLWKDTKPLHNLRRLTLSYSQNLMEIPNVIKAIKLEKLNLNGCTKLREIHPSIGLLKKLTDLNLEGCKNLAMLPRFGETINIEILNLRGCTKLRQIDPSIGLLKKLTDLNLEGCKNLAMLPRFGETINIEILNLRGCTKLRQIDPSIGLLKKLTFLNLKDCKNLVSLPNSLLDLKSLEYLSISGCSKLFINKLLDEPRDELLRKHCEGEAPANSQSSFSFVKMWPLNLLYSRARKDTSTVLLPFSLGFPHMRELYLSFCNLLQIPDAIGNLHCLERLDVSGNNFATLPSLKELSKLYYLNIQHCKLLKYLCELPSRTELSSLPSYICSIKAGLYVFNCPGLVERELCTNKGFSWTIQIIEALQQCICESSSYQIWPPLISTIIPGSEIPRWFRNQHVGMGSLITIDSLLLENCAGNCNVGCCVVFPACSSRERILWMDPQKSASNGYFVLEIPLDIDEDLVTDNSDHMLLFYVLAPMEGSKLEIDVKDRQGFGVQVKRYGYSWDT
ncbi:unnamed protein product [Sphenostylis stenocarpa]|uniref:TIR domain-containing protein n=1 Tax=Sphenostylis stenocarpa TaxID=92480 RepID=A0AA86W6A6_9FABA|nr:unnamed protein product [Sphenostylis stenocarpa]